MSKNLKCNKIVFSSFRMRLNDDHYMEAFRDELRSFINRIKERAQARIEKAMEEYEAVSLIQTYFITQVIGSKKKFKGKR